MLEVASLKTQLSGLAARSDLKSTAEEWGTGDLEGTPEELLPDVPNEDARAALTRIAKQCQSIGPRVVSTKRFGAMGDLNWGSENAVLDRAIRALDVHGVADEILEQSYYSGFMAGITRRDPDTDEVRVEPMVGHVEPIYSRESPTLVVGVVHAWRQSTKGPSGQHQWTVRLYDIQDRVMREWRDLTQPQNISKADPADVVEPSAEYPGGAPVPRFAVIGRGRDRMPLGEVARMLPLLFSDWSSQVRGDRIEESTAIPQLVVSGDADDGTNERSPTHVIRVYEDGDAKYLVPGDMATLHEHHNRKLERIREDGNLPGGFLGGQTPSGEALREANAKFISSSRFYARMLSEVLTGLVNDLAEALDVDLPEPVQVTVTINREFTRQSDIEDTVTMYRNDLVEHGAAVRHLTPYVPTWEDESVEEFIESRREVIPREPSPPDSAGSDE